MRGSIAGDTLSSIIGMIVWNMRYALIKPGEDGWWIAECPSLPGCFSQGKSEEEATTNIKEAINLYIEALEADGLPVP
jgi:predicted RNase H-like HicB family nuclease